MWSISGLVSTTFALRRAHAALLARRVAVVADGLQPGDEPAAQRPQLVLRERLGWEHEQRRVFAAFDDTLDDRELVAERLPRRGPRREHDVAAVAEVVDRRGLV